MHSTDWKHYPAELRDKDLRLSQRREGQKVYTTDVVVEDQEFAESKAASAERGVMPAPAQSPSAPAPSQASVGDGFMNIPDGIDEELPFN